MMMTPDLDLVQEYARTGSEEAFSELVARHLDLVYSAALRQVRSSQLAEEIAQSVFGDLAQNVHRLKPDTILTAWLYQVTRRTALNVSRGEARRRAREQIALELADMNANSSEWTQIEPWLDEAMETLDEPDRAAILLRYFENKSLRHVGETFGVGEDAAQKPVSRAVERLREFFSKRNVTIGTSGLVVLISTNGVQAAPIGLTFSISAAVTLVGNTLQTSTAITTTKTIAMTTLQKMLITTAIAVTVGTGIYEVRKASKLRSQVQTLQRQQAPWAEQVAQLNHALANATNRIAGLSDELVSAKSNNTELLKLRGEIGVLRAQLAEAKTVKPRSKQSPLSSARAYYDRAGTHYTNHDYEAQLEDLDKAIELDPNMAQAYFMRGNLYASNLPKHRGGYEKAIADYTRCLEIKPNDAGARWNRAMHSPDLGRPDEAIADWTTYLEGDTDFSLQGEGKTKSLAGAHFYRGRVYHWQKKTIRKQYQTTPQHWLLTHKERERIAGAGKHTSPSENWKRPNRTSPLSQKIIKRVLSQTHFTFFAFSQRNVFADFKTASVT